MVQHDDIKTSTIAIIGLIGSLVTFLIVVLLIVLYQEVHQRQDVVKRISQPFVERDELAAQQQAKLNECVIPIDRAMELVVSERAAARGGDEKGNPGKGGAGDEN